jgi:hypothetical protein
MWDWKNHYLIASAALFLVGLFSLICPDWYISSLRRMNQSHKDWDIKDDSEIRTQKRREGFLELIASGFLFWLALR